MDLGLKGKVILVTGGANRAADRSPRIKLKDPCTT
jgi:hypothetical protein